MISPLHIIEDTPYKNRLRKKEIIQTFDNFFIRLYCWIRFLIIPMRLIDSIGQFVSSEGCVLDMGCGFGLFTLFYAMTNPDTFFIGIDLSESRIQIAQKSAKKLGLTNVTFIQGDVRTEVYQLTGRYNMVYSLDLFHHIPIEDGNHLAHYIYTHLLSDKGVWVLKDVSTRPRLMLYFTFLLDWMMNPLDSFYYRNISVWKKLSSSIGYVSVEAYEIWDVLPYPHFILVARK